MVCIYCDSPVRVTNSRQRRRTNDIWRRRECMKCGNVSTSIEKIDLAASICVEYSNGKLCPFIRDRLFVSVLESCKHRPTALHDSKNIVEQVIGNLISNHQLKHGVVANTQIISEVYKILKGFDIAASTHYAAYHALPS